MVNQQRKRMKSKLLSKEDIIKKNLCITCDLRLCNNKYELCPYKYNLNAHLCLTCNIFTNEIDNNGYLKCYNTCPYRKDLHKGNLNYWKTEKKKNENGME